MSYSTSPPRSSAARINFFDALVEPEVVLPLVLSHLLSDALWERRASVVERMSTLQSPHVSIPVELHAIQRFIDRNFEHMHPSFVGERYGMLSIEDEAHRLGETAVRKGLERVLAAAEYRQSLGINGQSWLLQTIDAGRFPNYTYPTYDVIRAHRRFSKHRKGSSHGVLSCLDEMALFCAAALTLPKQTLYHVIMLCGASHYTVMLWDADRNGYWLPSKRSLFSAKTWQLHVSEHHNGDAPAAVDTFLCEINRIISVRGVFNIDDSTSSIPEHILHDTVKDIEAFFGVLPRDLSRGLERPIIQYPSLPYSDVFEKLSGATSRDVVRQAILDEANGNNESWAVQVLLAFRSVHVPDIAPYLLAARQDPLCREAARAMMSLDDAVEYLRCIQGYASIFGDRDRIALPDETIRLQTGTDRDRGLLLYALLCHIHPQQDVRVDLGLEKDSAECKVYLDNTEINVTALLP